MPTPALPPSLPPYQVKPLLQATLQTAQTPTPTETLLTSALTARGQKKRVPVQPALTLLTVAGQIGHLPPVAQPVAPLSPKPAPAPTQSRTVGVPSVSATHLNLLLVLNVPATGSVVAGGVWCRERKGAMKVMPFLPFLGL